MQTMYYSSLFKDFQELSSIVIKIQLVVRVLIRKARKGKTDKFFLSMTLWMWWKEKKVKLAYLYLRVVIVKDVFWTQLWIYKRNFGIAISTAYHSYGSSYKIQV